MLELNSFLPRSFDRGLPFPPGAGYTSPMPPAPSGATTSYGPRRIPAGKDMEDPGRFYVDSAVAYFIDVPHHHTAGSDGASERLFGMHRFTLEYWQDEGWYVGRLKEVVGVASQGETLVEL